MGRRISKEFLHPSILEGVNNKIGNLDNLETDAKDNMVQAINELADKIDTEIAEGKELIANAVGEPLTAEESFDEMSTDINGLLSTFKTNMMNNGITVESSDRFKSLIDKIATLADNEGKGIQFAEGTLGSISSSYSPTTFDLDIDFEPTILLIHVNEIDVTSNGGYEFENMYEFCVDVMQNEYTQDDPLVKYYYTGNFNSSIYFSYSSNVLTINTGGLPFNDITYYAIGVGEEDTTLRDSLASILTDEGVSVTEEDDMASLITKVDSEFDNKENEIEDTKDKIYDLMVEGGYEVNDSMTMDDLLEILELSGINVDDIKQIAVQAGSLYVVKENGSLWVYGENGYGQLGLGSTSDITEFTKVTTNVNNDIKEIITNEFTTFILKNDGSIWACGDNEDGQLGLGNNTTPITKFTKVTTNVNNDVKQVASCDGHTVILKNDGSVWVTGRSSYGQLGLGVNPTDKNTFTQVTTNINNDVKQIACGGDCTFILKTDGSLWVTGRSQNGQLGLGSGVSDKNTFTQVTENINNDVRQIFCRDNSVFIIKNDNTLWACGWNYSGQLGLNSTSYISYTFTQVTENINNDIRDIYVGDNHTIMVKTDGSLWACGSYLYGCLGLGDDSSNKTIFTQVTTNIDNDVRLVGCGYYNTFIVKTDGSLWGCGHKELLSILTTEYLSSHATTFIKLRKGLAY